MIGEGMDLRLARDSLFRGGIVLRQFQVPDYRYRGINLKTINWQCFCVGAGTFPDD